jgi:hypothetical protein
LLVVFKGPVAQLSSSQVVFHTTWDLRE